VIRTASDPQKTVPHIHKVSLLNKWRRKQSRAMANAGSPGKQKTAMKTVLVVDVL